MQSKQYVLPYKISLVVGGITQVKHVPLYKYEVKGLQILHSLEFKQSKQFEL